MPVDSQRQLAVLTDILKSHQLDCCGTVTEYEQAARLAQTLLNDASMQGEIHDTLSNIEQYTSQGATHDQPEQYILENQTHLGEWLDSIDRFSAH